MVVLFFFFFFYQMFCLVFSLGWLENLCSLSFRLLAIKWFLVYIKYQYMFFVSVYSLQYFSGTLLLFILMSI